MNEWLWFYITLTLDVIPFILGSVIIARKKSSCSLITTLIGTIGPLILFNALICITYMNGLYGSTIMVILRLFSEAFAAILLCLFFKHYTLPIIYICLFTLPYNLGVIQISAFIINFIDTSGLPEFMMMSILRFGLYTVFCFPYFYVVKNLFIKNLDVEEFRVWLYFAISQLILDLAMIFSLKTDYASKGIDLKEFISQMIIVVASICITVVLFYAFKWARNIEMEKNKIEHDELLLDLNSRKYNSIQANIAETKRVRHDIKHHIRAIEQMLDDQKYDEAKEYLRNYIVTIPEGINISFCENFTINALLEYYYSLAKNYGIDIAFDVVEIADCHVKDIDLNILLGNALENAIEGCKTTATDKPFIKLRAKKQTNSFFVTIDNSFDGIIELQDGDMLSKKRSFKGSGYGNKSIDAVVDKYNGSIKREIDGNVFKVSIVLRD